MELSAEARQILEVLAQDYEKNSHRHLKEGIPQRALGASIHAYLGNVMYPVAELTDAGLASRIDPLNIRGNIVITQEGYHCIRPPRRRVVHWVHQHPLITIISIVVTIIGVIMRVADLVK